MHPKTENGQSGPSGVSTSSISSIPPAITGRHILVALILFFGIVIAVNTALAVLANTSWTGLVVENGYVESQRFNQELAEARKEAALGWMEEFGYRDGRIELRLKDRQGRALARLAVSVRLERPSTDREDQSLTLAETAPGIYTQAIALKPGQWDADVTASASSGEVVRRIYRVHVSVRG